MGGIEMIAAERKRQIDVEKFSELHDQCYRNGELTSAAICYAGVAKAQEKIKTYAVPIGPTDGCWPWAQIWWKPSADPVRNLEKAGALIAAEIDRILAIRSMNENKK